MFDAAEEQRRSATIGADPNRCQFATMGPDLKIGHFGQGHGLKAGTEDPTHRQHATVGHREEDTLPFIARQQQMPQGQLEPDQQEW